MADNQDADIDEIIGQEDLELDELDNSQEETEQKDEGVDEGGSEPPTGDDKQDDDNQPSGEEPKSDDSGNVGGEPQEAPAPLTKEDIQAAFREARETERNSTRELDELTDDVLKKYYPDGLSNVLIDEKSGKELRSPQDVVDASGGSMTIEEATQWLMNEQYKLDQDINRIKDDARNLAETNANFTDGIQRVLGKYKDVFAKFPDQQQKVYKAYMKQVKMDDKKDLVLSAPDIEEFYDFAMEPYMLAYGNLQANQPASQPTAEAPNIPDSKPSVNDRLDESGDGGGGKYEADPNNADESLKELFGE